MRDGFVKVQTRNLPIRVADCAYNANLAASAVKDAAKAGVHILCLQELGLTGYTCGDLFTQRRLLDAALEALDTLRAATEGTEVLTLAGLPLRVTGKLYNCAAVLQNGRLLAVIPKTCVPNYGEFYELRHFAPAPVSVTEVTVLGDTVPFGTDILLRCRENPDLCVACEICEDLWAPAPPSISHALAGATVICNLSASNEVVGKAAYRRELVKGQSGRLQCAYLYCSAGYGESTTDLVFSGHSLICEDGAILKEGTDALITEIDVDRIAAERQKNSSFLSQEDPAYVLVPFSLTASETSLTRFVPAMPFVPAEDGRAARCEEILTLQAAGLQKRLDHTKAKTAVVGLSGGLDSTLALLVTVRAFDALGRDRRDIWAITMPCFGTTSRTRNNAAKMAEELGVSFRTIPIGAAVEQHFKDIGLPEDDRSVTYENSQARERTQVLMDFANRLGGLVIGTGDLSEMALGWCTYNGDHMSMYGVNCSIPKTLVRHLVAYEAAGSSDALKAVLLDILDTPVSPELLPPKDGQIAQKTEDLVGPYEIHDFFLYHILRFGFTPRKVYRLAKYALGEKYDDETLLKWLKSFYKRFFAQQFKRSCVPDGPKIGTVTLSPRGDWRMPSDACADAWLQELEEM